MKASKATQSKALTEWDSLRDFFVSQEFLGGIPDTFRCQPALFEFATNVQGYVHDNSICILPDDSIQFAIIEALAHDDGDVKKAYKTAKSTSLGVLFDCFAAVHLEKLGEGTVVSEWASAASKLMHSPELLCSDHILQTCLVKCFSEKPEEFMEFLMNSFRNFKRRKEKEKFHMLDFILATLWTNSHHPLWLMQQGAINKICNMFAGEIISSQTLKERLRKRGLKTFGPAPIVDVELRKGRVIRYKVHRRHFNKLPFKGFGLKQKCFQFPTEDKVEKGLVQIGGPSWKDAAKAQKIVRKWLAKCDDCESQLACHPEGTDNFNKLKKKYVQFKLKHNDAVDALWNIIKNRAWESVEYKTKYDAVCICPN